MFMKDEKVPFEDAMTIPVIRADSCSRYAYAEPTRKIYYPYAENGDNTVLIPLQEIKTHILRRMSILRNMKKYSKREKIQGRYLGIRKAGMV